MPQIQENFNIFDFELSEGEMESIVSLDAGLTTVNHNDPEFLKYLYNRTFSN